MHEALLDWRIWDALSDSEREAIARGAEPLLRPVRGLSTHGPNEGGELRLTLRRVGRFEAADAAHSVAQFQLGDAPILFSLVQATS